MSGENNLLLWAVLNALFGILNIGIGTPWDFNFCLGVANLVAFVLCLMLYFVAIDDRGKNENR